MYDKDALSVSAPEPSGSSGTPSTMVADASSDVEKAQQRQDQQSSDPEDASTESQQQARSIGGIKWFIVCTCIYLTDFLYGLDTTVAADIQGPVVEQFGRVDQLTWVGVGFFLGSVAVILPFGELFGSFDMKWLFSASVALFEVGSVVCGAAPNMNALIIGRVIAGIGGSGIYLGGLNVVSAMTAEKERGTYIALIGFFWGLGAVLGPVVGGLFSDSGATWRWAFYINLVVGAIVAPGILWLLPSINHGKGVPVSARLRTLDFAGFILGMGLWVSFTMLFTMAGSQWAWDDGRTIAMFVVLGVILAAYSLQQAFTVFTTKENRSVPVHLLKSRTQVLLVIANVANITVLYVVVYFIPIYFQFVHQDSALMAAVRLLPFVIITVVCNVLAGYALPIIQYYMVMYIFAGIVMTLGSALLLAYFDPSTPAAHIYGFTVLIAIGCGLTTQCHYTIGGIKAKQHIGQAIAMHNLAQIGGATIALVVAGQIFQSFAFQNLNQVLAGMGFSAADIRNAIAGAQSDLFKHLSDEVRDEAIRGITKAMQKSFGMVVAGSALTIAAGLLMKFEKLFE